MRYFTIYLQLHRAAALHPDRARFLWDEYNSAGFTAAASTIYLPVLEGLLRLVMDHPSFKVSLGLSGVFLEQADRFAPAVIVALQDLVAAGRPTGQIELLDAPYYYSLTAFFRDPRKQEFRDQVSLHRELLRRLFDFLPRSFSNTELLYSAETADVVADMGYRALLCELRQGLMAADGTSVSPLTAYRVPSRELLVIMRHPEFSRALTQLFAGGTVTPAAFAEALAAGSSAGPEHEVVLAGIDLSCFEAAGGADTGISGFLHGLPEALASCSEVKFALPVELTETFRSIPLAEVLCSESTVPGASGTSSCGWSFSALQGELYHEIETMEQDARRAGGDMLGQWRQLTGIEHLAFVQESGEGLLSFHHAPHPYGGSAARAAQLLTRKIDDLQAGIKRFEVLKKRERTALLMITPETGRLPKEMGALAQYISGKSGGQGEVVSALCEGLVERGVDVHLVTLNLKKRFQRESQMSEGQWRNIRYRVDPEKIHLVSSAVFADNLSAYEGDPLRTAAEFQRTIVNTIIKEVRAKHEGRLIIHSHDWMAGGVVTAYAKAREVPVLHTVHNVFTACIPLEYLAGVDIDSITTSIYYCDEAGRRGVDSQATAIKNATIINFVGQQFLREVVNDYFLDRPIVPLSVRQEVKAKYYHGAARAIINAPSHEMYPERCRCCVRRFGPDDDIIAAKRENLAAFQERTGLNPDPTAILFYWPSRLDPVQKGVELLEAVLPGFLADHRDVQVAVVADGIAGDRTHTDTLGGMACASGGHMTYQPFSEALSLLGYAAANDVFGASLYEPCGQIDQVGNLFGATATNRDTGGYHDKIRELRLKINGAPQDVGNGFLFRDYDPGGLRYGLAKSLAFHRLPPAVREPQLRRIMREARERYDLGRMIAEYMRIYEILNQGRPLT